MELLSKLNGGRTGMKGAMSKSEGGRMITKSELPEVLKSGQFLRTHTGTVVEVIATTKRRTEYNEPLYRLRYKSGTIGHRFWTVDELQAEGCGLVKEGESKNE